MSEDLGSKQFSEPPKASNSSANSNSGSDIEDSKATARQTYIDEMREKLRESGIDAFVTDVDGKLVINSEAMQRKPDREKFVRNAFGTKYRQSLCTIGFRSIEVKTSTFGDGDEYSLGCKETTEEKNARLKTEMELRRQYISDLQTELANNQETSAARVEEEKGDLVITMPSLKGMSSQAIRAAWGPGLEGNAEAKRRACAAGFRGVVFQSGPMQRAVRISYNCKSE